MEMVMKNLVKGILLIGALSLAGCGGSDGGSVTDSAENLPSARPVSSLAGYGFDGLIIDGDVNVYDFTGGNQGALLVSGKTDGQGFYEVSLSTSDKAVLIVVDGGFYTEEASGVQVPVDKSKGHKMMAVEYYQSGRAIDVSATFFTNIATGYFKYLVKNQGFSEDVAVERAYAAVDAWAGFDTRRTQPVDVSDFANATPYMTDAHRYGFVAAGVSTISLEVGKEVGGSGVHGYYTSIAFNQLAYEDVAYDGLLDGVGSTGRLTFGKRSLNSNSYRDQLALSMLRFVKNNQWDDIDFRNATGMSFDDLLPFAAQINHDAGDLFGGVVAPDITTSQPVITQFVPANGTVMSGTWPVSVLATDLTGVESIKFYVDDRYVSSASPKNGTSFIVTTAFTNGNHVLRVEVTNFMGKIVSLTRNVIFNNGQLTFKAPAARTGLEIGISWCEPAFNVSDTTGMGARYIKYNGNLVTSNDPLVGPYGFNTKTFTLSGYPINTCGTITAEDGMGRIYSHGLTTVKERLTCNIWSDGKCIAYESRCSWRISASC